MTMSDLIRRSDVIKAIEDLPNAYNGWSDAYDKACIIGTLEEVPTIEPIEWIPCSERLPEKHGEYLITTTYLDEPYVTTDEYFSYGWDDWGRDVVAWAERPKPWKGEVRDE